MESCGVALGTTASLIRNQEVAGSIPARSTKSHSSCTHLHAEARAVSVRPHRKSAPSA